MASRYEVELNISSARDTKNVNWRHGPNKPYAVVWVDPKDKRTTRVDEDGDTCPSWNETLVIALPPGPIDDKATLCIDIVHHGAEEDTKPLIGSARLSLKELVEEAGIGERVSRTLHLHRPSSRPQGKLEIAVEIREPKYPSPRAYAPLYGQPYAAPPPYGQPYAPRPSGYPYEPPQGGYPYAAPQGGYPYAAAPAGPAGEYVGAYGQAPAYGYTAGEEKKSKFGGMGMGTGMAVGAAAGVLGGLALAEGIDAIEDSLADDVAEKVEEDLGYDDDE